MAANQRKDGQQKYQGETGEKAPKLNVMWAISSKEGEQQSVGVIRSVGHADRFLQPINKSVWGLCSSRLHPGSFTLAGEGDI